MNTRIVLATAAFAVLASCTLFGCSSEPETPTVPSNLDTDTAPAGGYTLTDEEKLKALAVGETASWRDYEVTVTSIDRDGGRLTVELSAKSHGKPLELGAGCLLSFGMPPVESSFEGDMIEAEAGGSASGTLTFDDQYGTERLFWNDKAIEAAWDLTLPAVQDGSQQQGADEPEADKPEEPKRDEAAEAQKQAIAALEAEIPSLFANNTLYTYQSVDSATATVTPQEGGGYEYVNDVGILDGAGNATTVNVLLICEPNGNCISMTVDGAFLF